VVFAPSTSKPLRDSSFVTYSKQDACPDTMMVAGDGLCFRRNYTPTGKAPLPVLHMVLGSIAPWIVWTSAISCGSATAILSATSAVVGSRAVTGSPTNHRFLKNPRGCARDIDGFVVAHVRERWEPASTPCFFTAGINN